MSNTFNRKQLRLAAACALALGVLSGTAQAQTPDEHSIVTSSDGKPVMDGDKLDQFAKQISGLESQSIMATRPTTVAGECKDARNTTNVACMQPDRDVFIEVSGTRLVE